MKYIKKDNKYIKKDLTSLFLYYDFFSPGFRLKGMFNPFWLKLFLHKVLKFVIFIVYITNLYRLSYEVIDLDEDFIIRILGKGEWANEIVLKESKGKLFIYKKVASAENYEKEKKFYNLYKNNKSRIKLPKHVFLPNNLIQIEFIKAKTMQRLFWEGSLSNKKLRLFYQNIAKELPNFYKNNKRQYLVHGDFGFSNIFKDTEDKHYYLIDYSDSFVSDYFYDKYVLFRKVLLATKTIKVEDSIVGTHLSEDFKEYEDLYFKRMKEKHPGIY